MNLKNRRFVRGLPSILMTCATKSHACYGICTLSPLCAKKGNTTRPMCCACHAKWHRSFQSAESDAKVVRLPRKASFDTSWNMLECHKVPRLPREAKLRKAGKLEKWHLRGPMVLMQTVANGCGRLRTVANGCGRVRTVSQHLANTVLPPHLQNETGTLATHSGKNENFIKSGNSKKTQCIILNSNNSNIKIVKYF